MNAWKLPTWPGELEEHFIYHWMNTTAHCLFCKYYSWALFTLLRTELDPISLMYPLTNLEADKLSELYNASFCFSNDPMIAYSSLIEINLLKKKFWIVSCITEKVW